MREGTIIFTISIVGVEGALNSYKFTIPIWLIKGKENQDNIDIHIHDLRYSAFILLRTDTSTELSSTRW
jgi:hypothetical protein